MLKLAVVLVCAALASAQSYDLVVYGGTAGGVVTAVSGARMGLKTVLLEPRRHIGGMVTGGLSATDIGKREVIGGYALEFYWRAGNVYEMARHRQEIAWNPEPHVAETILGRMLQEAGVTVVFNQRLREKNGVAKSAGRIQSIAMESGEQYSAKVFADCTTKATSWPGRSRLHLGTRSRRAVRRDRSPACAAKRPSISSSSISLV